MTRNSNTKFNKILNEYGGFVVEQRHIKFILDQRINECGFYVPIDQIGMRFTTSGDRLVSAIRLFVYEPVENECFVTLNIKVLGFNLKTYRVTDRKPVRKTYMNGQPFTVCSLIAVEVL